MLVMAVSAVTASVQGITIDKSPISVPAPDFWDQAYHQLRTEEPKLVQAYEQLLCDIETIDSAAPTPTASWPARTLDRQNQLMQLVNKKIAASRPARKHLKVGDKEIGIQAVLDGILSAVVTAQGFIAQAASGEPHTALAWAGVSVLLPVSSSFDIRLVQVSRK